MIVYLIGGAILAYIAYQFSTPERRRRWPSGTNAPSGSSALDSGDPTPPLIVDIDADAHHGHHHHDPGSHHGGDYGGDHGGHHGGDFDTGGGGGHHH